MRATRDLAKSNASLVSVLVYGSQRGVHAARSCKEGIPRISVSAPRNRRASRWFQASRSSRRGRSLPRTISHSGSGRGDTSHQTSGTSSSAPSPTPHASPHRSPLPLPLSPWCPPPRPLPQADVTLKAIQKKMSRGTKGACGARCRSSRAPIIPISYVPFLSRCSSPLPCLFVLFLLTRARVLVPIVCRLSCSLFPVVPVLDKVLSHFGAGRRQRTSPGSLSSSPIPPFFCRDP